MRSKIRLVFESPSSGLGRLVAVCIQALILLSIVTFCIETLPDLRPSARAALASIELACIAAFSVEYVLRVWSARRPLAYVFSFFGLVDLLAILPFYVAKGIDFRAIRVLRALRLVRILKLTRHSAALARLRRAAVRAREELMLFLSATLVLMFLASVGIYYCEREAQPEVFRSIFDAMWWAVTTLSTVGYGDAYPVTAGGKVFTFIVLLLGLGVVAIPSAIFAAALTAERREESGT